MCSSSTPPSNQNRQPPRRRTRLHRKKGERRNRYSIQVGPWVQRSAAAKPHSTSSSSCGCPPPPAARPPVRPHRLSVPACCCRSRCCCCSWRASSAPRAPSRRLCSGKGEYCSVCVVRFGPHSKTFYQSRVRTGSTPLLPPRLAPTAFRLPARPPPPAKPQGRCA